MVFGKEASGNRAGGSDRNNLNGRDIIRSREKGAYLRLAVNVRHEKREGKREAIGRMPIEAPRGRGSPEYPFVATCQGELAQRPTEDPH